MKTSSFKLVFVNFVLFFSVILFLFSLLDFQFLFAAFHTTQQENKVKQTNKNCSEKRIKQPNQNFCLDLVWQKLVFKRHKLFSFSLFVICYLVAQFPHC